MLPHQFYSSSNITKCVSSRVHFSTSPTFKEQKIKIRNYEINYLTVGRGPHYVFCLPSSFGTIFSDFRKQIEGFDRDKFSLVVWDSLGYGKSTILDNKDTLDVYTKADDIAFEFMEALQMPRYSLIGWSKGAGTCLQLAARHPEVVNKVVSVAACAFMYSHEIENYKNWRNINTWPKPTRDLMIQLYGEENFKNKINNYVQVLIDFYDAKKTLSEEFKRIQCPTFLLHGEKDTVVSSRHLEHLHGLIANSRTHLYPDGGHNIHVQYADDFNKRVQEFLLEPLENNTISKKRFKMKL